MGARRNTNSRQQRVWAYWHWWDPARGAVGNPKRADLGSDVYDPRLEALRAMRQAIYEQCVARDVAKKSHRAPSGERYDLRLSAAKRKSLSSLCFGAYGTKMAQRSGYIQPGSATKPTAKGIRKSKERYADVDRLVRNRQDYEETLAFGRMDRGNNFYRATREPVKGGLGWFVWPIPPGQRLPIGGLDISEKQAKEVAFRLSEEHREARRAGRKPDFWKPPKRKYTKSELSYWLPPASIFRS